MPIRGDSMLAAALAALVLGCAPEQSGSPTQPEAAVEQAASRVAHGRMSFVEGYDRGKMVAGDQRKPMLLFFTAEWCDYCHQMADDALSNDRVVELSDQFVCVLVDADAEPDVCRAYEVRGYPTVLFLSPTGLPLNRLTGKQPGRQLLMEMQAALQAIARDSHRAEPLLR